MPNRMERLERTVKRQRLFNAALLLGLGVACVMGMARQTPEEMTLRKLTVDEVVINDLDGKQRIRLATTGRGFSGLECFDRTGVARVLVATDHRGTSLIANHDMHGKARLLSTTSAKGDALLGLGDQAGVQRMKFSTESSGNATMILADANNVLRVAQVTTGAGQAGIMLADGDQQQVWGEESSPRTTAPE